MVNGLLAQLVQEFKRKTNAQNPPQDIASDEATHYMNTCYAHKKLRT